MRPSTPRRRFPLLIALPLLCACVKAPPRVEPEVVAAPPESWSSATHVDGELLDRWWTAFDDPQLTRIVEAALASNLDLSAAASRVDQAIERAKIAGADLQPSVSAGVRASRSQQNFVGLPIPGGGTVLTSTATTVGASLDVSWEVDLWGRLRADARAAVADLQATEADYHAARLSIAAQTAKIWFAIAEAQQQVDLARTSADSFHRLTEQVRARFVSGVRSALDLRLAISNEAAAESAFEARRRQLDGLVRQLETIVADYPDADLLARFELSDLSEMPPPVPTGLPSELVTRRPDLVAAERRLAAADQRFLAARRSLYPRLTLTASGGTVSDQLGDLLDGDFAVWSIAGGLLQPVFQGGRLRAQVRLGDAVADEALSRYADTVLTAFAEVERTLAAEQYLVRQEQHLSESAKQLTAAERLAEERYRNGVGGYLAVLESQTRAFVAQSSLLELKRVRLDNRIDLHLALGGDFTDPRLDIETIPESPTVAVTEEEPS